MKRLLLPLFITLSLVLYSCGPAHSPKEVSTDTPSSSSDSSSPTTPEQSTEPKESIKVSPLIESSRHAKEAYPDKTILTYVCPHGIAPSDSEVYVEFNRLLDEKGYDFAVDFFTTGILSDDPIDYQKAYSDFILACKEEQADVDLFFTGFDYYGGLFAEYIYAGVAAPIEEYLKQDSFSALRNVKDPIFFDILSDGGRIYGVTGGSVLPIGGQFYYHVNDALVKKYQVDLQQLIDSPDYFKKTIEAVAEGEGNRGGFYPLMVEPPESNPRFLLPEDIELPMSLSLPLAIRSIDNHLEAFNPLEDSGFLENLHWLASMQKEGVAFVDVRAEEPESGSFFLYVTRGDIASFENCSRLEVPGKIGNRGNGTCIAAWSQKQESALRLIQAIYTDPELNNLLAHGIEGKNYTLVDGKCIPTDTPYEAHWADMFLCETSTLIDPAEDLLPTVPVEEVLNTHEKSPLLGVRFDFASLKARSLEFLQIMHQQGIDWTDLDSLLSEGFPKINTELKAAGIKDFIDEINRELKEKGLQ